MALPFLLSFSCTRKNVTPKDTLIVGISAEPANLDPRFALDADSQRIDQLIYDSLIVIDENLKVAPHLATRWENPAGTLYRFELHQNAKFHDGFPVIAETIVHNLKKILDPEFQSPYSGSFKNIKSIKAAGAHRLEIRLKEPQASFLTDLSLIKAVPLLEEKTKDRFTGSGPYQFEKKTTHEIILKRNPLHFKFQPKFEKIIFKIIKDDHTRLLKLKKGEIDLIQNALPADALVHLERDKDLVITKSPGLTYAYLGFNLKDPILQKKKIRQAIAHAINRKEIIQHLLQNLAVPAKTLLSPLNWYYEDRIQSYDYDPQKAKSLLKASGLPSPVTLTYKTSTSPEAIDIARLISDHLNRVGFQVTIQTNEWGTFFKDIQSGNFQLFSLRWVGITEPDIYYECFYSSNFPPGKNRVYYQNPKLDKLLEAGKVTLDPIERKKIFSEVQKIVARDLPYVSLWHLQNVAVYRKTLKNFRFHPQANFLPFMDFLKP